MLVWSPDQHRGQYPGRQLREMLADVDLRQVESKPAFGHCSIVTGAKPSLGDACDPAVAWIAWMSHTGAITSGVFPERVRRDINEVAHAAMTPLRSPKN
jgi:hypothetical protein